MSIDDNNECPGGRIGHISAFYKGYMFVLGGYNGYNEEMQTNYLTSDELWIYDSLIEKWFMKRCTAETSLVDIPPGTSGASCSIINDYLYLFGGYHEEGNSQNIYRLNLNTLKWKLLEPSGQRPLPCDKTVCWNYNNKLFVFAGYGCVPNLNEQIMRQRDYQFVLDPNSHWHYRRGWNNQFACYDPEINQWSWPSYRGKAPMARAAHAAAKVGTKVFIFGGRHGRARMQDLCYIDMENMCWSEVLTPNAANNSNTPVGRSWHSFTPLSDEQIVLFGGFSQDNRPLNDCWKLNVETLTWTEVDLPFKKPRLWHTATLSPFGEILVFGGGTQNILNAINHQNDPNIQFDIQIYAGDIITIRFSPKSLLRLSLDSAISNSQILQKQWSYLPLNIQKLLDRRKQSNLANPAGS